ncbi:hypothetical protein DW322_21280 [Rhodococcus rhodnii]|uniref:Uncharacterized protein n=2 Tax=Rhodococcus rhodnii TaxID=38312 RepID=R7WPR8_9NOCA|nr:hypothetical protein [Rhodococcus rhodnii]EOM77301.1 hypothetical protein Rrhod_1335 [Rhodococcus rhodnii LMG 5362]TXG88282.1 hypothetical protein DW322_21610 [Rhodococcus rhodnii]TXG88313.1 hypothetical protein DW322_21360 [Rhodococcus rhodnii]TXG89080.1 hypothetical protein DW322_00995 [Rhodococcus rhodnii]TXG92233.1 hypothetical protein DW322_21280 [Rhodococcus rhodnii]
MMIFGLSPTELALIVTAFGGGTTLQAAFGAIKARRNGARAREERQISAIRADLDRARESLDRAEAGEREAWARADAMENRYDRMTQSRNRWRERSHHQDVHHLRHCSCRDELDAYPPVPVELDPTQ